VVAAHGDDVVLLQQGLALEPALLAVEDGDGEVRIDSPPPRITR
jgi:hypothetical protein